MTKKAIGFLFATMAIVIGLYPLLYFFLDKKFGLLSTKDNLLFSNTFWKISFYVHILLGGLSLLVGWPQFSSKIREKNINLHRILGKIYVFSALISALASLYIALYATGGLIPSMGFFCLGILWFYSTLSAFLSVKKGKIKDHEKMMIYSFALCFAAVTLRIWLPLLTMVFNDFITAYRIVAWLCWIPNLLVAFFIVKRLRIDDKF